MTPRPYSLRRFPLLSLLALTSCGLVSREPIDEMTTDDAIGGRASMEQPAEGGSASTDLPNQVGVCHFEDEEFARLVRRSLPYGSADRVLDVWALSIEDEVTSLQGIECLSGLTDLYFHRSWYSPTVDLAPLAGMTKLRFIIITDGEYESVGVLSTLALHTLRLSHLDWTSLDALHGSNTVESLELEDVPALDLSALASFTNLRRLTLDNTSSTDLSPLQHLDMLEELEVIDVPVKTLPNLGQIDHLHSLTLDKTDIVSLEGLAGAPALSFILIQRATRLKNLAVLEGLPLFAVHIEGSGVSDVSALAGSTSLKRIEVMNSMLEDISPLGTCQNLAGLNVSDNYITDLSPLASLPLSSLNVARNWIQSVSPLIGMPLLTLDLTANNVTTLPADFIGAQGRCARTLLEQNPLDGPAMDLLNTLCGSTDYTFLWDGGGCDRCP